jgi:hypothetical protein
MALSTQFAGPTRRLAVLSLLSVAVLGLAACGGDDDDEKDKGDKSEQTNTTTGTAVPSDPQDQFNQLLRERLEEKDRTEAQVDCVVAEVNKTLSDAEVEAFIKDLQAGEPGVASELVDVLKGAAEKCQEA